MGCDIHVILEKKTDEKYNSWERVSLYHVSPYTNRLEIVEPYNDRDYELFSLLAGVRGYHEPLVSLRGVPENLSSETEMELAWWDSEYHSLTWYDLNELYLYRIIYQEKDYDKEEEEENRVYRAFINFVNLIEAYLDFAQESTWGDIAPNKYRVIIWFDS